MDNIKFTVTSSFSQENADEQNLTIETDILGAVTREVVNLKGEAIRKALIALGWTPPQQQPADVAALVEGGGVLQKAISTLEGYNLNGFHSALINDLKALAAHKQGGA